MAKERINAWMATIKTAAHENQIGPVLLFLQDKTHIHDAVEVSVNGQPHAKIPFSPDPALVGEVIDARDDDSFTALMHAANKGCSELVKFLLHTGANANLQDKNGRTALWFAAYHGHTETIKSLHDADAELTDRLGRTPLAIARSRGHQEAVTSLEEMDWFHAAHSGDRTTIQAFLDKGWEINRRGLGNNTAIVIAGIRGTPEFIDFLLERGAHIEETEARGHTALHVAAERGNVLGLIRLLERGAKIEATDKDGATPLHMAAAHGRAGAITELLARGANRHAYDGKGYLPIHAATFTGNLNALIALAVDENDLTLRTQGGGTLLHMAAAGGHQNVITALCDRRADVTAVTTQTATPLHAAAANLQWDAVTLLLRRGANLNARDMDGQTPLAACLFQQHKAFNLAMARLGADPFRDTASLQTLKNLLQRQNISIPATIKAYGDAWLSQLCDLAQASNNHPKPLAELSQFIHGTHHNMQQLRQDVYQQQTLIDLQSQKKPPITEEQISLGVMAILAQEIALAKAQNVPAKAGGVGM